MFKRRDKLSWPQRLRRLLWPRMGFGRLATYWRHRLGRLPGTPEFIAMGIAIGTAISCTPFLGFHLLLGFFFCWLLRASILGMVVGSMFGNFWTSPLIFLIDYKVGHLLMGNMKKLNVDPDYVPDTFTLQSIMHKPFEFFWPMSLGSLPVGLLCGGAAYYLSRRLIRDYKARKAHGGRR